MGKKKVAKAIAVTNCPKCKSKELLEFEGDHFCLACSWDSLEMSVERGDLDDALFEYEETLAKQAAAKLAPAEPAPAVATNPKTIDGSAA